MNNYTQDERCETADGEKVLDRCPTADEVKPYLTERDPFNMASIPMEAVDKTKAVAVNPTPCGVYDGDVMRWEISEIAFGAEREDVQVADCLGLYKTLDEAVREAVTMAEKVYIIRNAV